MAMVSMLPVGTSNVGGSELNIHYGASSPSATSGLWVARDSVPPAVALSGGLVFDSAYYTTLTSIMYPPNQFATNNSYYVDCGGGVYNGIYYFVGVVYYNNRTVGTLFSYNLDTHIYTNLSSIFSKTLTGDLYGSDEICAAAMVGGRMVVIFYSTNDSDSSHGGRDTSNLYVIDLETSVVTSYTDTNVYWYCGCRAWGDEVNGVVWAAPTGYGRYETSHNGYIAKIDPLSGTSTMYSIPKTINTTTYGQAPGAICATDSGVYIFGAVRGSANAARKAYVSTNGGASWTVKSSTWTSDTGRALCAIWMGGRDIFVFCSNGGSNAPTYLYKYNMDMDTYTLLSDALPALWASDDMNGLWPDMTDSVATAHLAIIGNVAYYVTNQVNPSAQMHPIRFVFELTYPYPDGSLVVALSNTKNRVMLLSESPIIETGIAAVYEYTSGALTPQIAYTYDIDGGWMQI